MNRLIWHSWANTCIRLQILNYFIRGWAVFRMNEEAWGRLYLHMIGYWAEGGANVNMKNAGKEKQWTLRDERLTIVAISTLISKSQENITVGILFLFCAEYWVGFCLHIVKYSQSNFPKKIQRITPRVGCESLAVCSNQEFRVLRLERGLSG